MKPTHPAHPGYLFPAGMDAPAIIREETPYLDIDKIASLDYRGKKIDLRTGAK